MTINFENLRLPKIYKRDGRECYLDPIRQKLIFITPEETVRQKMVSWLMDSLEVPKNMIKIEEPLKHYGLNSKRRADIIIHGYIKEKDCVEPIAVIECKAPNIYLDEKAGVQMMDYSDDLGSLYSVLTNGIDTRSFIYDAEKASYVEINTLPKYEQMIEGVYDVATPIKKSDRIPFEKLLDEKAAFLGFDVGETTDERFWPACFNFSECLYDVEHKLPEKDYRGFRLIQDYGLRWLTYGNAGGGTFYGPYRSFLIETQKGSTEIVSIGISTYGSSSNSEVSKTVINVAIDNEKDTHHALQLVIDDNVGLSGDKVTFYHHGRIAIGNMGSGKVEDLRAFVEKRHPELIDGKRFNLGTLTNNSLWHFDDEEMIKLAENLISYALIRDEYRAFVKNNKKESKK